MAHIYIDLFVCSPQEADIYDPQDVFTTIEKETGLRFKRFKREENDGELCISATTSAKNFWLLRPLSRLLEKTDFFAPFYVEGTIWFPDKESVDLEALPDIIYDIEMEDLHKTMSDSYKW